VSVLALLVTAANKQTRYELGLFDVISRFNINYKLKKMELKEAKEIVGKFKEAIQKLEWDANSYYTTRERCQKLEDKNKELKQQLDEAIKYKYHYNLLASVSTSEICQQCDGRGGFDYDMGEQGGMSEQCGACMGYGLVEKAIPKNGL
jgi:hypothetical protein